MKMTKQTAVKEVKVVEVKPATYTIELDEKEFYVLGTLVGSVNGGPDKSEFRRVINKLWTDGFNQQLIENPYSEYLSVPAPEGDLPV